MRIVVDTNIFFSGFNPKGYYYPIINGIYSENFKLLVSTAILLEYEEVLQRIFSEELLDYFWLFILTSDNVIFVNPTFNFQLPLTDVDDQKFVDCAVCGGADFLITNDKHYNILKGINFPKVKVIKGKTFVDNYII